MIHDKHLAAAVHCSHRRNVDRSGPKLSRRAMVARRRHGFGSAQRLIERQIAREALAAFQ
jgi:hypothetical protein